LAGPWKTCNVDPSARKIRIVGLIDEVDEDRRADLAGIFLPPYHRRIKAAKFLKLQSRDLFDASAAAERRRLYRVFLDIASDPHEKLGFDRSERLLGEGKRRIRRRRREVELDRYDSLADLLDVICGTDHALDELVNAGIDRGLIGSYGDQPAAGIVGIDNADALEDVGTVKKNLVLPAIGRRVIVEISTKFQRFASAEDGRDLIRNRRRHDLRVVARATIRQVETLLYESD
jgi:hypothetical protein